ncbi:universal stress protein [Luteococcus peritonei]|uniref:Universal stress protein n=1 Tax=Luteococcus peritonei TaxID=88874 RepID=A0ABW4RT51_9ACTN
MSNQPEWFASETRPRILVGVDGSEDGLRAVRYGARRARRLGGVLHLVHAVDDAVLAGAWGVVYDPSALQEAGEQANQTAVEAAHEVGLGDDQVHPEVVLGNGAAVLTRLSEGADLLVVGRRSVSGLERMFIGSTSIAVASGAHCPVVVISNAANPGHTGDRHRIAVGVDAQSHSVTTLEWAFRQADSRDAALQVVHVAKPVQTTVAGDQLHEAAQAGIEQIIAPLRQQYPGVECEVLITRGVPVDELVNLSETVDLLVLGVPKPRMLGFGMGGVMRAVLAHGRCPVALVK